MVTRRISQRRPTQSLRPRPAATSKAQIQNRTREQEVEASCDAFVENTLADYLGERASHIARVQQIDANIVRMLLAWAR